MKGELDTWIGVEENVEQKKMSLKQNTISTWKFVERWRDFLGRAPLRQLAVGLAKFQELSDSHGILWTA